MSKTRVAILGLGLMGTGMAKRLLSEKFPVVVYNRSRDQVRGSGGGRRDSGRLAPRGSGQGARRHQHGGG